MFSQDDYPVSDASVQTRQKGRILTPASDTSSPNALAVSGVKKRKRDGNSMEELLKTSFIVRPHPSSVFDKPRTLHPLILLPRYQLPLSSLNLNASTNPLPQSRLFEAHVKILELEDRIGSQPMLLVARLDDGRTLYAVEREDRGLYVLCQLGSWVDLQKVAAAGTLSNQETLATALGSSGQIRDTQEPKVATTITAEAAKYSKKKRLAIEAIQSMVKRPSTDVLSGPQMTAETKPVVDAQESIQLTADPTAVVDPRHDSQISSEIFVDATAQPTAAEIFESVRNQYFEALYLSKATLAYFAKGPLSRARAAFHLDYDSTLDMNDHIAFLESLILSTTMLDKKYKDGVPQCVSLIDVHDLTADNADRASEKSKKKRTSKKMKPGKTGLYPSEDTLIRKWWDSYDEEAESGTPHSSREETAKRRIADLRIRETQLQMVVLLEVLALQPLASPRDLVEGDLPIGLPGTFKEEKEKPSKSKKPEHLKMLVDVHIDRLCIWQSIALETGKVGNMTQNSSEDSGTSANIGKHSADVLRDFCVDIIVPFFSARLPELCSSINQKLGGPVAVTPSRPRLSKAASFSSGQSRPGAATKRPVPSKPRQSLQRVLSDNRERRSLSRGPSRAISLMRSASIPNLKREASEPASLSNIPLAESQASQSSRSMLPATKRLSQREVDLSSRGPEGHSKASKQAKIEAELKEAISALKKPNRELAGKEIVETAEQRAASSSRSSRKSKKPMRNPLFQGVQISATPKANRSKDVFEGNSQRSGVLRNLDVTETNNIPPSSLPRIPQSAVRSSQDSTPARNPFFAMVQATPTRKSAGASSLFKGGHMDPDHYSSIPPSSPLQVRRSSAQLFVASAIQETPVKMRPATAGPENHRHPSSEKENARGGKASSAMVGSGSDSIYKSLGWDADDDIDDLT